MPADGKAKEGPTAGKPGARTEALENGTLAMLPLQSVPSQRGGADAFLTGEQSLPLPEAWLLPGSGLLVASGPRVQGSGFEVVAYIWSCTGCWAAAGGLPTHVAGLAG